MSLPRSPHHLPRHQASRRRVHRVDGILVVDGAATALAVIDDTRRRSPAAEVFTLVLGDDRRVRTAAAVDGCGDDPDAVLTVVETFAAAAGEAGCADLVVASVRRSPKPLFDDAFRWLALSELAETGGALLLEWFVLSGCAAFCPRDLVNEPPRW